MSESVGDSSSESGEILDWALVDHGDLEGGDSSSTTSSVEVMAEEEETAGSVSVTDSSTGPKFVLRLASKEHLVPDSDEETTDKTVRETTSFDVIPSLSTGNQDAGLYSTSAPSVMVPGSPRGSEGQKFSQQISREDIEQLVQAITEVQSSVSLSEGSAAGQTKNDVNEEITLRKDVVTSTEERSRSQLESDAESLESSVSSRFSFLTQEKGNIADFEDSESERYKTESIPSVEAFESREHQDVREEGSYRVLYRAPSIPGQEENDADENMNTQRPTRAANDNMMYTIKLLDKIFNISILAVISFVIIMVCCHNLSGPAGRTRIVDDEVEMLRSNKVEADMVIKELRNDIKSRTGERLDLHHQHLVEQNRLEKALEKCKVSLNDVEQENSDLKAEIIRLKYSAQHDQEKVNQEREPDHSKVANGDTPYIHCGPGKVMKRHHEVDGDTMYFCDWDKNGKEQLNEEKKEEPPIDKDVLAVEGFCEKILGNDVGEKSRQYKKLKKLLKPGCRKALKQEQPDEQPITQPVEDNSIPCQSCYQKLSQAENNWLKAENEKEAAVSRSELWKELYTRAVEREAERNKAEEESQVDEESDNMSQEPVSLKSCWKFVVSNLTAGNHLFESFGLYWEEVENLMLANFSSLFDFWIHSKWKKAPEDDQWQEHNKDEIPEIHIDYGDQGPWTGGDSEENTRTEGPFDWGDTVNSVLNKTKESVTTVNKQIQDTWKQVKNMSKQLWKKHEPTIVKMHNTFSEKISKLGEKFQEKLRKKTEHWFKRANRKHGQQDSDEDLNFPKRQGQEGRKGKHHRGLKKNGRKANKKQNQGGIKEEQEIPKEHQQEIKKRKGPEDVKKQDQAANQKQGMKIGQPKVREDNKKAKNEQVLQDKQKEEKVGRTKRRPHLDVGGIVDDSFLHVEDPGIDSLYLEVPKFDDSYEKKLKEKALGAFCNVKFEKLRKAANSMRWRAKNIDAWANLAEEYSVIGERLMLYDIYEIEQLEDIPDDQRGWYDCQLAWWSNNLKNGRVKMPENCNKELEQFQKEKRVVDPKKWWNARTVAAGLNKKDPCLHEKLEIIYSLLQYKLDLFQIDMCRHRIPPCTYREHLYMDADELRDLFLESEAGSQSDAGNNLQNSWLFDRAEYRKYLREHTDETKDDYNDDGDYADIEDDDDDDDIYNFD